MIINKSLKIEFKVAHKLKLNLFVRHIYAHLIDVYIDIFLRLSFYYDIKYRRTLETQ